MEQSVETITTVLGSVAEHVGSANAVPLAKALAIGIPGFAVAIGLGLIGYAAMTAIGRNPEASGKILVPMLLIAALTEAVAIYALVIAFSIQ